MNIDYKGMSVTNRTDYMKIRKIMAEPELELGQEFDVFADEPRGARPETASPDNELKNVINKLLELLTERESEVIKYRFALDEHKELMLHEVGDIINVSRERVRQIEAKALRKLRHPTRSSHLKEYLLDNACTLIV
jgi:RNA polymerase primary sigma factor